MDDRRFDGLAKALATGKSRRSVIRGLLGLGGITLAGGSVLQGETNAARRPTPTPRPPICPGRQTRVGGQCQCVVPPAPGPEKCGPDCCNPLGVGPARSECCDNACCFGTCLPEEGCCATNGQAGGLPPLQRVCTTVDGPACCGAEQLCCSIDGCCDTVCWGGAAGDAFCCDQESFCAGGGDVQDVCCVNSGNQLLACCNGGTEARVCYDISVSGACCTDADCGDPCQVCSSTTNICEARCRVGTACCPGQDGSVTCLPGDCCLGVPDSCPPDTVCCAAPQGPVCVQGDTCAPNPCTQCDAQGLDCCVINDVFASCIDFSSEGACCTADTCEEFNDFANCLVGACTDFQCEQVSSCLATQYCCGGECSDSPCNVGSCQTSDDCASRLCCGGVCCLDGQSCLIDGQNVATCLFIT